ncbi:MAG TPA: hypothetical protein VID48_01280 [Solirubrobacteraceae bacterium]
MSTTPRNMPKGAIASLFARRRPAPVVSSPAPLTAEVDGEQGVVIARRLAGERILPQHGPWLLLGATRLRHHLLVTGATGFGKTETLLRLAWTVARSSDAPVYYMDGKGDRANAERFAGLMADAGREVKVFPNEPFDGWRGEYQEIHSRLMRIIDYAEEGPAAWYRDVARSTLRLVCDQPQGPPRSSRALLERLDFDSLALAHPGSSALDALSPRQVAQVRLRYEAFFGQLRGQLDGAFSFEDTSAAYLLLDSLTLPDEVPGVSRFLFEDFMHYIVTRKHPGQLAMLIVDEFSGLADGSMSGRVEKARGYNASLILAPQVIEGMGGREETARILGSVGTLISHRVNTPDEIVRLAGTRMVPQLTTTIAEDGVGRERTVRMEAQLKIDPNHARELPRGHAYIISEGRMTKAQILMAPKLTAPLPEPQTTPAGVAVKDTARIEGNRQTGETLDEVH